MPDKQLLDKMNYEYGRRPCELNDHDVREHVDWMTRYSDEAWRALERRVNKMQSKLRTIAVSENNFETLREVLQEMQNRNHAEMEELRRNVLNLSVQHSEMHEDFRDMRMNVQMIQRNASFIDETHTSNIQELKKNYTRINTSVNTIGDDVQELKDRFNHVNGEVNRFNALNQASSEDIKQFKRTINHKVDEIGNNANKIQKKNQQEVQELKRFMNEKITQCKECVRKEMKDNLNPVNIRISTIENEIRQCMTKITENDNFNKEEIKNISEKIDNNTRSIQKQISQTKEKCQNLKDSISKIKNQQDKLEKQILLKLMADQTQINSQIKTLTDKVRKVEEKNEEMEVLSNKVAGLLQAQEEQRKKELEKLFMQTPHRHRFQLQLQPNTITLNQSQGGGLFDFYQVLLGVVLPKKGPFVLHANITSTQYGGIMIGVVDRRTQKEAKSSWGSGNAVCYDGGRYGRYGSRYGRYGSRIHYANNGKSQFKATDISFQAGTKLRVKVELDKGMATFTIAGKDFLVHSDILSDPNRQFVPYFEMWNKGDSVEWRME